MTTLKFKKGQPSNVKDPLLNLKRGIWLYFLLLIFEGALRKWVLPGLAAPILIIRDPIALYLILKAYNKNIFPANFYVAWIVLVTIISVITALLVGHGNLSVAIYGARIFLFHFPVMFIIGRVFRKEDVLKVGRCILAIAIPMLVLVTLQFYSPQSAWVNRGVGGNIEGGGFSGALGYFRPPATFSFTTGTTQFFSVVGLFVFYFWISGQKVHRNLLIASTICLIAAIPLSISRSLFIQVVVTGVFATISVARNLKYFGRIIIGASVVSLGIFFLSKASFFQTATEAFTYRFTTANESEGGLEGVLIDRFLGGMIGALTSSTHLPFFGLGIGMGTNAGALLLTGSADAFLISEGEWGRLIGEVGPLLGISLIFLRINFCFTILKAAYLKLRQGEILPWVLISFGLIIIAQGQWAQPTTLGFSTFLGGLILASLNKRSAANNLVFNSRAKQRKRVSGQTT